VLQAVRYAAGLPNDAGSTPLAKAHIINLSLGGSGFSQLAQDVFNQARDAGVIIIAAAGNESSGTPGYPAGYDGVVSVSAVDINKNLSWYSNFGATIDVAAPGGDTAADINADGFPDGVLSTCGDDRTGAIQFGYCFMQGTSMAAPHMAGVVALMKAIYGNLTPADLDTLLASGTITEDIGTAGRDDQFGHGMIDALKAAGEAEGLFSGGGLPAVLVAEPASINFGISRQAVDLILRNAGGGLTNLNVTGLTPSETWLTITPTANVGADGLGTYAVTIDDSGLGDGVYSAKIDIATDANDGVVSVTMQVGIPPVQGGDAGFHYVLLLDAETLTPVAQDEVAYNGSGYSYSFTGVSAGSYKIYAGTDSDNDIRIGDAGEAFGAYQTIDQPIAIELSENTNGLDFTTGFNVTVPAQKATGNLINRLLPKRLNSKTIQGNP
jgi:serine protease